jgi:hypothetical protein
MSWTKRQLVEAAYAELALSGWVYDLEPDEMQYGLMRLDTLMATWAGLGMVIGYNMATSQDDSDLDQDSGVAMIGIEAVFMNLAVRIAANKGKTLQVSTTRGAKQAYDALVSIVAKSQIKQQQLAAGTPQGQGCKPWRITNPYVLAPNTAPLQGGDDGGLGLTGLGN